MFITDFEERLENVVIPQGTSQDKVGEMCQELDDFIFEKLPKFLYKYRCCNERNIEAFYHNQIWVANAEQVNDGYDTRIYFNRSATDKFLEEYSPQHMQESVMRLLSKDIELPSIWSNIPGLKEFYENLKFIPEAEMKDFITACADLIKNRFSDTMLNLYEMSQKATNYKFVSFSSTIQSPSMWGLYADNETGFALSYNFRDGIRSFVGRNGQQRQCAVYPIIYKAEKYRVSDEYIHSLLKYNLLLEMVYYRGAGAYAQTFLQTVQCPDIMIPIKVMLHKSKEWKYEKEWRMICTGSQDPTFLSTSSDYFTKIPKALYLGRRIRPYYEKLLVNIAHEKELPVYKMQINDTSKKFLLKYTKIK